MRAVVQRVTEAAVHVSAVLRSSITHGLLVYLGVDRDDCETDIAYLVDKVRHLRIFNDESDRMNLDISQTGGQLLIVSAFTVQADARRGRRPAFDKAAESDRAAVLYELFCQSLQDAGLHVEKGAFGEHMEITSTNDGPVCILLDSRRVF